MPAMGVNDDARCLMARSGVSFFASELAPAGRSGAVEYWQGLWLVALGPLAQLRKLLLQQVALFFELAQFITTDRDVESLCWPCCLYCAHCSPRKWCFNCEPAPDVGR